MGGQDRPSWRDASRNPNSQAARARRAAQLEGRWAPYDESREELLASHCRDANVLDLGCVAEGASARLGLLHRRLVAAARSCVGVDCDVAGVEILRAEGYDVVLADVTGEPTRELLDRAPFDRIVAGELIEHLDSPADLLRFARPLLDETGQLLITTPNPYALHRVRAGWDGLVWENVDHVTHMFPSGIVELADRTGFELVSFGTVRHPLYEPPANLWPSVRRYLAKRVRRRGSFPFWYVPPYIPLARHRNWPAMRETMVYTLTRLTLE